MLQGEHADVRNDPQLLLVIYMYNYLVKNGFHESANALVKESQKVPNDIKMSIIQSNGEFSLNGVGSEENFLYDWWCALWSFQSSVNPKMNQALSFQRAEGKTKTNVHPNSMPPPSSNRPNIENAQQMGRIQQIQGQQYMLQQQMLQQQGVGAHKDANMMRVPNAQQNGPVNVPKKQQPNTRMAESPEQIQQKQLAMKQQQEQQQRYHEQLQRQHSQLQAQQNMHVPPQVHSQTYISPQQSPTASMARNPAPFPHTVPHSPQILQQSYAQKPKDNRKRMSIPSLESQNSQNTSMAAPAKNANTPAVASRPRKKSELGQSSTQSQFTTFVPGSQTLLSNQQFPEVEPIPNAQIFNPNPHNNDNKNPNLKDQFAQDQQSQADLQMQWQQEGLKFMQRQQDPQFANANSDSMANQHPGLEGQADLKPDDINSDLNVESNSLFDSDWFGSIGTDHGF